MSNDIVIKPRQRDAAKRGILQAHPLFGRLSPSHIDRLVACIVTKLVPAGTTICAKGDPGTSLFAICAGVVQIVIPAGDGRESVFNQYGKGKIFGEIALLDGHPRTADVVAMTDCELFVIERRDFLPMLREEPDMALQLIEILCERVRHTTEQAENLMYLPLPSRLARALLRLSERQSDAPERKIAMTQKALAGIISMSRESTNKQLAIWERRKWVRLRRGEIGILSVEALERVAEGDGG